MKIVLCDDLKTPRGSINQNLKLLLEKCGNDVRIFDGRDEHGSPLREVDRCAIKLEELILEFEPTGMVMDLMWWTEDPGADFGIGMLRHLRNAQMIPRNMKIVIYSRFTGDQIATLQHEFNIPRDQIFDRSNTPNDIVARLFCPNLACT